MLASFLIYWKDFVTLTVAVAVWTACMVVMMMGTVAGNNNTLQCIMLQTLVLIRSMLQFQNIFCTALASMHVNFHCLLVFTII